MSRVDDYPEDCVRIKRLAEKMGLNITLEKASDIWSDHSNDYCAGWMILPKNDEEIKAIIAEKTTIEDLNCPHCGKKIS